MALPERSCLSFGAIGCTTASYKFYRKKREALKLDLIYKDQVDVR